MVRHNRDVCKKQCCASGHLVVVTIQYEHVIDMYTIGISKPRDQCMKNGLLLFTCILLTACQGSSEKDWATQEDCAALSPGDVKDDCYGHFIVDIFKTDSKRGMQIMNEEISNDSVRDFLWLEITRKVDPTTTKFCQLIKTQTLMKRCQTLVSRPHLHRETLRKNEQTQQGKRQQSPAPQRKPQ